VKRKLQRTRMFDFSLIVLLWGFHCALGQKMEDCNMFGCGEARSTATRAF
jgi:hypothetical protein